MEPLKEVARKMASLGGLVAAAGLALTACAGAATSPDSAKTISMPTNITVTVPDSGWRLGVERVIELDSEVWVLAQLRREPGPAAQVIQKIAAAIPVTLPEKRLRVFVAGKKWNWRNDEPWEFVASLDEVARRAGPARVLYPQPAAPK